jgi:dTDP-4-dehydrorhamnose reductase
MTDQQILELVRFHFEEGGLRDDGSCSEYFGTPEDFIEFAQAIFSIAGADVSRVIPVSTSEFPRPAKLRIKNDFL